MNVHFNRTIQNMCKFVFGSCFRTPAVKKKKQKKSDFLKLFSWGLGSSRTVPVHIYSASVTVQRHKMLAICACKYLSIFQNVAPFQHSQPQTPHDVIVGWHLATFNPFPKPSKCHRWKQQSIACAASATFWLRFNLRPWIRFLPWKWFLPCVCLFPEGLLPAVSETTLPWQKIEKKDDYWRPGNR